MEKLSTIDVKNFFAEFMDKYRSEVEQHFLKYSDRLALFNSSSVKFDLLFDKDMSYCVAILSKGKGSGPRFNIDTSFIDPMCAVAMANHKKYMYGEEKSFLYIFQTNAKRFGSWQVSEFVKDFINYELSKNSVM